MTESREEHFRSEDGAVHTGHVPVRMCVMCRKRYPKKELTRHICPEYPGEGLVPDLSGIRPGRGFYVCRNEECRRKLPKFRGWKKFCKGVRHDEHNAG